MKLWILLSFSLVNFACCSDKNDEYKNEERRIAGGGNYGGFIGLTTYGAGPFLVKGKFERNIFGGYEGYDSQDYGGQKDQSEDNERNDEGKQRDRSSNDDSKKDDETRQSDRSDESRKNRDGYNAKYIGNVGYEDIQRGPSYYDGNYKNDDDYLEYLGYRGGNRYCFRDYNTNRYGDGDGYRDGYGQGNQGYLDGNSQGNRNITFYDDERRERCDDFFGYTGPTANDGPENLVRPCALADWQCVRKYFAANGKCKPAYGPIPDPLYMDTSTVFFPVVNLTVALPNRLTTGLSSARIRDFYINRRSGNLVLALDVTNLNDTIPRAYFRYRRTAKESIVLADYVSFNHRAVTFTAVIPKVPNLRLDLADIHADIQDIAPSFLIGPGAYNSTDPDVVTAYTQFIVNLPVVIREAFLFQAQLFTAIYIQENICDFGLKIISV